MLFNSLDFAFFLPIVFLLYWAIRKRGVYQQNILLLAASYFFYGWWDWRFLFLILLSTLTDYFIGKMIIEAKEQRNRKMLLGMSLLMNLGLLVVFKYYNFFLDSFQEVFSVFGYSLESRSLNLILPVGISFYTFQTLSYTIDIYKGKLRPTNDFIAFASFVSFFPQLVAGPIERASRLLPQFQKRRAFDYSKSVDGLRQMLWGFFKKVVIADNCAFFADLVFNDYITYDGSVLLLGALFFTFQIYCDFSGYSDIAIGTARLFGFELSQNFAFPYFSRDIGEFWRRWHISLSTWFRDYLYIPLGGSRVSNMLKVRNVFAIFLVSGFWHGANWTFIVWGGLNALYFLPSLIGQNRRWLLGTEVEGKYLPSIIDTLRMSKTFFLVVIAWIFFRADNVSHAFSYIKGMMDSSLFTNPSIPYKLQAIQIVLLIIIFTMIEWRGRKGAYGIEFLASLKNSFSRNVIYYVIVFTILIMGNFENNAFIYFQF